MSKQSKDVAVNLQGVGVGLRAQHFDDIITTQPKLDWLEVLADNFMQPNSMAIESLMQIRNHYPMVLHSVGMSLGSQDPLNKDYFRKYKNLIDQVQPELISDHLCWISNNQNYLHELLPLPFTQEAINHVSDRIVKVQDLLGQQIAIENVSSYLQFEQNQMFEWEFINHIAERSDCFILFDINNLYVNAVNHGIDPQQYIDNINQERVKYLHLAGFEDMGTHLLDTHGAAVFPEVWQFYQTTIQKLGPVPTLIEWDNNLPPFETLLSEANKARKIMEQTHG